MRFCPYLQLNSQLICICIHNCICNEFSSFSSTELHSISQAVENPEDFDLAAYLSQNQVYSSQTDLYRQELAGGSLDDEDILLNSDLASDEASDLARRQHGVRILGSWCFGV